MLDQLYVYPCAYGVLCDAVYDDRDHTITIFRHGTALGRIKSIPLQNADSLNVHDRDILNVCIDKLLSVGDFQLAAALSIVRNKCSAYIEELAAIKV